MPQSQGSIIGRHDDGGLADGEDDGQDIGDHAGVDDGRGLCSQKVLKDRSINFMCRDMTEMTSQKSVVES